MTRSRAAVLVALGALLGAGGCNGNKDDAKAAAEADKKALSQLATQLSEPMGLIAAYRPYLTPTDDKADQYSPKDRMDLNRAAQAAANEVRHAANTVHQSMPSAGGAPVKELDAALVAVSTDCAEVADGEAYAKCRGAVDGLDKALGNVQSAASSAGADGKIPKLGPEAITEQAKKAIAPFLRARGPGAQEKAYWVKRADASASSDDVIAACQSAAAEVDSISRAFEHADEPLRVLAVTHKMSMDSQCNALNATDALQKDLEGCRKKPKTPDCKIVCGKSKAVAEQGVPAATFTPLSQNVADICKE